MQRKKDAAKAKREEKEEQSLIDMELDLKSNRVKLLEVQKKRKSLLEARLSDWRIKRQIL